MCVRVFVCDWEICCAGGKKKMYCWWWDKNIKYNIHYYNKLYKKNNLNY